MCVDKVCEGKQIFSRPPPSLHIGYNIFIVQYRQSLFFDKKGLDKVIWEAPSFPENLKLGIVRFSSIAGKQERSSFLLRPQLFCTENGVLKFN